MRERGGDGAEERGKKRRREGRYVGSERGREWRAGAEMWGGPEEGKGLGEGKEGEVEDLC